MDNKLKMGLLNLHDAFLNADLQMKMMQGSPIETDLIQYPISMRGRFERTWAAFLYVLYEAWRSQQMGDVRKYIASVVSSSDLDKAIWEGEKEGKLLKLREARHYMAHRDKRKYWDDGRHAVFGELEYNFKLHSAFSKILLEALKSLKQ